MILCDLHVHTTFCDGDNTAEEMVLSAIEKNMECIGFSAHSYTFYDESYCLKKEQTEVYINEINVLKEKYKNHIRVLCGIEQDFYSDMPTDRYDYVICSVHYLKCGNDYLPIDENTELFCKIANDYYSGNFYKMAADYYNTVSRIKNADIIGHFDIITKFNDGYTLFDEKDAQYVSAYQNAVTELLKQKNICFEINTSAMRKGFKTAPYPSADIISYIEQNGGNFVLSSDAHSTDALMYNFDLYKRHIKNPPTLAYMQ